MKQAVVFLRGVKVGILTEDENCLQKQHPSPLTASPDRDNVATEFHDSHISPPPYLTQRPERSDFPLPVEGD